MKVIGQCLDKIEFTKYVKDYSFGTIPPNRIVLHHTWKPTKVMWNGKHSIAGLKTYYEGKGWQTGPHLFIADDGIWLFTPFYDVGVHAGTGNATYKSKFSDRRFNGYIGVKGAGNWKWQLESYSIGIEMVGNYDSKRPSGKTWDNTLHVIKTLMEELKMPHDALKFHRDYTYI